MLWRDGRASEESSPPMLIGWHAEERTETKTGRPNTEHPLRGDVPVRSVYACERIERGVRSVRVRSGSGGPSVSVADFDFSKL